MLGIVFIKGIVAYLGYSYSSFVNDYFLYVISALIKRSLICCILFVNVYSFFVFFS